MPPSNPKNGPLSTPWICTGSPEKPAYTTPSGRSATARSARSSSTSPPMPRVSAIPSSMLAVRSPSKRSGVRNRRDSHGRVVRPDQSTQRQKGCPSGSRRTRSDVQGWCSCLVAPRSSTAASAASRSSTTTSRCICWGTSWFGQPERVLRVVLGEAGCAPPHVGKRCTDRTPRGPQPSGRDIDLPIQHRAVERGESAGVGAVDDDAWESCDSHAGHGSPNAGRSTSAVKTQPPEGGESGSEERVTSDPQVTVGGRYRDRTCDHLLGSSTSARHQAVGCGRSDRGHPRRMMTSSSGRRIVVARTTVPTRTPPHWGASAGRLPAPMTDVEIAHD